MSRNLAYTVCFVLLAMALPAHAGGGIIGIALSNGEMQVDQSRVNGNVNLSPGASLASSSSPARIRLSNGVRAVLAPYSAAAVFSDRLVLQRGTGIVSSSNYQVESAGMQIAPNAPDAQAQVTVQGNLVRVQAVRGEVKITGGNGIVLARVLSGSALDITPSAANSSQSTMSGVLRNENGKLLLHDKLTNLDVELNGQCLNGQRLNGQPLNSQIGRLIEVTGSAQPSADRQSQIIQVARWNRLDNQPEPAPTPAPAPTPEPKSGDPKPNPGVSGPTGMSLGAKVAISLAIAGAAAGATTYAVMSR